MQDEINTFVEQELKPLLDKHNYRFVAEAFFIDSLGHKHIIPDGGYIGSQVRIVKLETKKEDNGTE